MVIIVFATLIEILMPNSSFKKYIKFILGLLVMTIMLQPIFGILNSEFSLSEGSFKYQNKLDSEYIKKQAENYRDKQSANLTELYKQNLETQIAEQVEREIGDRDVSVTVSIIEDTKSELFGNINSISITIGKQVKAVDKVERVIIGPNEKKEEINKVAVGYESLRNKISAMYDVNKEKVLINTKNN